MIRIELGVEDLADTRFAISPLAETVFSLWELTAASGSVLHQPWLRAARRRLDRLNTPLLRALVGEPRGQFARPSRALPDFLTPRPSSSAPVFADELALVRATPVKVVRRDVLAAHAPDPLPEVLHVVLSPEDGPVLALLKAVCDLLASLWNIVIEPLWPRLRLVLEADMTYRARQLATGGARLLFADIHPNLTWRDGGLDIQEMVGGHDVTAPGRGLLLVPSAFAFKPVPPTTARPPSRSATRHCNNMRAWSQPPSYTRTSRRGSSSTMSWRPVANAQAPGSSGVRRQQRR